MRNGPKTRLLSSACRASIDALESRRLLTTVFNGTTGSDTIIVSIASTFVRVSINGQEQQTSDPNIVIDSLGGGPPPDVFEFQEIVGGTRTVPLSIRLDGHAKVLFGAPGAGIDMDDLNTTLTVNFENPNLGVELYDQDDDSTSEQIILYRPGLESVQEVIKGSFKARLRLDGPDTNNVHVFGGTSDDTFSVASLFLDTHVTLSGGGGNDQLQTINFAEDLNQHVLDICSFSADVHFDGGPGIDFLDLNDSADAVGDDDQVYLLQPGRLAKTNTINGVGRNVLTWTSDTVERVALVGDADNNSMSFSYPIGPPGGVDITVDGGVGNDMFVNPLQRLSPGLPVDLIGGSGQDTIMLSDALGSASNAYTFDAASFSYGTGSNLSLINYDSSMESFRLTENDSAAQTKIFSKRASLALTIDAMGGDDTFFVGGGDLDSNGFATVNPTLTGGAGSDLIRIEDQNDNQSDGSTSSYVLNSQSLSKGAQLLAYSGFENQTLEAANGIVVGQFNIVPTITFNAAESSMLATTIDGGAARGASVNIGNGSLFNLPQAIGINLHGSFFDRVTISDANTGGLVNAYQVTDTFVRRNGTNPTINYNGVNQMTLSTSTVQDSIGIDSTPTGLTLNVLTNGGDDLVNFGGDIGARIRGPVTMDGGAGSDSLTITNVLDNLPSTQTLTSTTFIDGNPHTYTAFERLTVNEGPGGANLFVNSLTIPTTVTGGSGPDTFTVGGGNIEANFPRSLVTAFFFDGGGGTDAIVLNDFRDGDWKLCLRASHRNRPADAG